MNHMDGRNVAERWASIIKMTHILIKQDEAYAELAPMDKLLTFYYYHFDNLLEHRNFVADRLLDTYNPLKIHYQLRKYKALFHVMLDPVIKEAIAAQSLKSLMLFNRSYYEFFWWQHLFVLRYWVTDISKDFDLTTALIEKIISSTFDFMGRGELRSSIDLWKFVALNPFKIRLKDE